MISLNDFSDEIKKVKKSLLKSLKKGKRNSPLTSVKIYITDEFAKFLKTKFGITGRFKRIESFFDTEMGFEATRFDDKFKYFIAVTNKVIDARIGCVRNLEYYDDKKQKRIIKSEQNYISIRFCQSFFY